MMLPSSPRPSHFDMVSAPFSYLLAICAAVALLACAERVIAGESADSLWGRIEAMDKGPGGKPKTGREAAERTHAHLGAQLELVREFLAAYPDDARKFDASMRSVGLTASMATLTGDRRLLDEALRQAGVLAGARGLSAERAADAEFQRVSILFLKARGNEVAMREAVVAGARGFHARFPSDPRAARLLVEAASVCDSFPRDKRVLLEAALRDAREEPLRMKITDDLRQIDRIGTMVDFEFVDTAGTPFVLREQSGKVVAVIFWSAESPHSLLWFRDFMERAGGLPANQVVIATVSLDTERETMEGMRKELGIRFPTAFDGLGWESPLARKYGINALPTVWLFDRSGRMRAANAAGDAPGFIRRLLAEKR